MTFSAGEFSRVLNQAAREHVLPKVVQQLASENRLPEWATPYMGRPQVLQNEARIRALTASQDFNKPVNTYGR